MACCSTRCPIRRERVTYGCSRWRETRSRSPSCKQHSTRSEAQFSPDGHWVAYVSDKSGRDEVYVRAFTPPSASGSPIAGAEWPVSTAGGLQPKWRNDGKELYYRAPDGKLMAVDVTSAPRFAPERLRSSFRRPGPATTASSGMPPPTANDFSSPHSWSKALPHLSRWY